MKTIYLTFDDGPTDYKEGAEPSHEVTTKILNVLKEYEVKATFFNIGNFTDWMPRGVEHHPHLARRVVEEGHIIGNHTYKHRDLSEIYGNSSLSQEEKKKEIRKELEKGSAAICSAVGYRPIYFRAPFGNHGGEVDRIATELGLSHHIDWGPNPADYEKESTERTKEKIINDIKQAIREGGLILCHESFEHTPEALEEVLPELKKDHCFKTLAEHPDYQKLAEESKLPVYQYHKEEKGRICFYYSTNPTAESGWTADGECFKSAPFIPGARPVRQYHHEDSRHPLRYAYTIEPYSENYGLGWTYDERFAFYAFKEQKPGRIPVFQYCQVIDGGFWNLFYSPKPNEPPQEAGWIGQGPVFYVYTIQPALAPEVSPAGVTGGSSPRT